METNTPNSASNANYTIPANQKIKSKTGCLGTTMILTGVIVILLLLFFPGCSKYNTMVNKNEAVKAQWAQVQSKYQRRFDLIGNLVETVKGYATHENKTLTEVIEARAKATSVNITAENLDDASLQKFQEAQNGLKSSLSRLMVSVEQYPDLKANTGFLTLQSQLEQTENDINTTRESFNAITKDYNAYIKRFPNSIVASIGGFKEKAYFTADSEAEKAPNVKF